MNQDTPVPQKERAGSDAAVAKLVAPGKYSTGAVPGLFVKVTPTSKTWCLKYRIRGVENTFTIGAWPGISFAKACALAEEARAQIAEGVDPLKAKKAAAEAQLEREGWTFERVAKQWLAGRGDLAKKTLLNYRTTLDLHLLPALGAKPVHEITWRHISRLLVDLGSRPTAVAHARVTIKQILDFAVDLGAVDDNVAVGRGKTLVNARKTRHHPGLQTTDELREYFGRVMDMAPPDKPATWALWLLPLLAVRPSELCGMRWEDIDFEQAQWSFTPTKTGRRLIVPLASQVIGQLSLIKERRGMAATVPTPFGLGGRVQRQPEQGGWVFASDRSPSVHLSPTTLLLAIRALGYSEDELTAHGFRSTLRSIGHEVLELDPIVLELSLGHRQPGPLKEAYARTQLLPQRRVAMQKWADFIENLCWEASNGVSRSEAESALVGL
ncbi:tyrosine-type recombinase/integrase [Pseudomonas sp. NPDC089401]|uniref:tyrosine-type recombinase/integrase n=1 Tax=Pseudomonas sp. NPDC089401 TaxID=3364462 RepID=UPI003822B646